MPFLFFCSSFIFASLSIFPIILLDFQSPFSLLTLHYFFLKRFLQNPNPNYHFLRSQSIYGSLIFFVLKDHFQYYSMCFIV